MTHVLVLVAFALPSPEAELWRFPRYEEALHFRIVAVHHLQWLKSTRALYPEDPHWAAWEREALLLHKAWDALEDAANPKATPLFEDGTMFAYRWRKLGTLRRLIGEEAYWLGRMPPPVPVWYFTEMP